MSAVSTSNASAVLFGVPFDWYVRLRDHRGNRHLRMTYYDGTLEITSPELRHEREGRRLGTLVRAYVAVLDVDCQGAGSTTFRRGLAGALRGKGKEPDESYYFGARAALVRDKDTLDLEVDPPPDLWIEVDNRGGFKGKLPLFAELGVPEVWRYRPRRRTLWFGLLENGNYTEIEHSRSLPKLTPGLVLELLDQAQARGETAWDRWMRDWMTANLRDTGV